MDKLSRDLDIVNLLDIIRGYHVMKSVLFNFNDRFLLHLQRRDTICSSESIVSDEEHGNSLKNILLKSNMIKATLET